MDVRLVTFLELCKQMNYRATADTLHITQPTVTQHIQSLEQEFNCKLFTYNKKNLSRTESTKVLQEYAQSIKLNEQLVHRQISNPSRRMLHIGATFAASISLLNQQLETLFQKSDYDISVTLGDTKELLEGLKTFRLDFALVDSTFPKEEFDSQLLLTDSLLGICAENHPFAGKSIPFSQLVSENLFLPSEGTACWNAFDSLLRKERFSIHRFPRKSYINNRNSTQFLVERNYGISFTFASAVNKESNISTFTLANHEVKTDFYLVYLKNSSISSILG